MNFSRIFFYTTLVAKYVRKKERTFFSTIVLYIYKIKLRDATALVFKNFKHIQHIFKHLYTCKLERIEREKETGKRALQINLKHIYIQRERGPSSS